MESGLAGYGSAGLDKRFPYSFIDRSHFGGIWCSTNMIGPQHVATALHCIPEQWNLTTFQPAYAGCDTYPSLTVPYMLISHMPIGSPC